MTIALTRDELIRIVDGRTGPATERLTCSGVAFDSRDVRGGELFVALPGEKAHGHAFVPQALERGAALCLVEDPALPAASPHPERFVVVPDTLGAFSKLAAWWRETLKLPVLAITGSVGKTTTKEIAAAALLKVRPGVFSLKSHNNHVGVPYTICRMGRTHEWAVLEMGMNHAGELTRLSGIAVPDVAVITCIAPAHIEFFGTLDRIADAKLEISAGLRPGGTLVLNGDDEVLMRAVERLTQRPTIRLFGTGARCDLRLGEVTAHGLEGISFPLTFGGVTEEVRMNVLGRHNAMNAAAAALGMLSLLPGLTLTEVSAGLREFQAPLMRLNVKPLRGERKVIDDSYNANPESMKAALAIARDLAASGLKVGLILGDMLELGEHSESFHREVGTAAVAAAPVFLVGVGEWSRAYVEAARAAGIPAFAAATAEESAHIARKHSFDIVLIKASRGIGLDRAVSTLIACEGEVR